MNRNFNVGDILVCINDIDIHGYPNLGLTYGKYYQNLIYLGKLRDSNKWVHIINDRFESQSYHSDRFVSVSEFRKMKINKLSRNSL